MKKTIQLPGYDAVIPNAIWSRESSELFDPTLKQIPSNLLVRLSRYSLPSAERVVETSIDLTHKFKSGKLKNPDLYNLFRSMNPIFIDAIADRTKEGVQLLYIHTNAHIPQNINPLLSGLKFTSGIVPIETISSFNSATPNINSLSYFNLISFFGANPTDFKLLINRSRLPRKSLMKSLLDDEARITKSLSVNRCDDYSQVRNGIGIIYSAINSVEDLNSLEDISEEALNGTVGGILSEAYAFALKYKPADDQEDSGEPEYNPPVQPKKPKSTASKLAPIQIPGMLGVLTIDPNKKSPPN